MSAPRHFKREGRLQNGETVVARSLSGRTIGTRAFTVLELLVAVTVMTVIVFALYQIFNTTQKALLSNTTQSGALEAGRSTLDMICRDLEQATPSGPIGATNLYVALHLPSSPMVQADVDQVSLLRTNFLQEFYFVTRQGDNWVGTGYKLVVDPGGVGSLYRFSFATNVYTFNSGNLSALFLNSSVTNLDGSISPSYAHVADGLVHLRLSAYDKQGRRIAYLPGIPLDNEPAGAFVDLFGQTKLIYGGSLLPAYLELDIGMLEPEMLGRYKANIEGLQGTTASKIAHEYLKRQASKVQLFRQRIPLRAATL